MSSFEDQRTHLAINVEQGLDALLTGPELSGPGDTPQRLIEAMRHGALNGGKRLRPLLVVQTAAIFGVDQSAVLPAALAVELVHCYSLVHDDLPAMDDDDVRRGRPTVHIAYDDATAILAGDALLTLAFEHLARDATSFNAHIKVQLVAELAKGAGTGGMVGGQMHDLEGEAGGFSHHDIAQMQAMKTGALIRACVRMGAIIGGAEPLQLEALTTYGEAAGRAFQLADDILDETATADQMGKATGKDQTRSKPTLISKIGLKAAQRHLGENVHHALSALMGFGPEADGLRDTARYFATREH